MKTANIKPADERAIAEAAAFLRAGRLVAFPTETVYGLGADATNEQAVAEIFAAKGRPQFNPLIVHVADLASARKIARFDPLAEQLAARFWPGPLTLVLPRRAQAGLSLLVSAGLDTVAVRVPAHPVAQALLRATDRPVAAPSANPSGRISPTRAAHVAEGLGDKVALILDGGDCAVGLESTVVAITAGQLHLLRPGAVTREDLAALTGETPAGGQDAPDAPRSPGQLASHYAPHLPVRLGARTARADEAALGFGTAVPEGAAETLNLSPSGDLKQAAANLFAMLRALDRPGDFSAIAIAPVPETGLGAAINDRLRRAAADPAAATATATATDEQP
ncbi:MAG TPA: threonylcarbamoyl-AMP synthase [Alphaproteobacteria bacterium]|nr:threonylcarbamoyl-AMP synthase [Alphaproteobacteria bacterium]